MKQIHNHMTDPKQIMTAMMSIKEGLMVELKKYRKAESNKGFTKRLEQALLTMTKEQRQDNQQCSELFERLLKDLEDNTDCSDHNQCKKMPQDDFFMSPDEILSCFIYVIVKAHATDIPALLTFVCYFTLEEL